LEAVQVHKSIFYYEDLLGVKLGFEASSPKTQIYNEIVEGKSPGFTYIGRCNRRVHYKNKVPSGANRTILPWLLSDESRKYNYSLKYRHCRPTLRTGYAAVQKFSKLPSDKYDEAALQFSYEFVRQMYLPFTAGSKVVHWEDVKASMNKKAICGYPFSLLLGLAHKKEFFELPNWIEIVEKLEAIAFTDPDFRVFWQVSQ
jgi:hypothetical protein